MGDVVLACILPTLHPPSTSHCASIVATEQCMFNWPVCATDLLFYGPVFIVDQIVMTYQVICGPVGIIYQCITDQYMTDQYVL